MSEGEKGSSYLIRRGTGREKERAGEEAGDPLVSVEVVGVGGACLLQKHGTQMKGKVIKIIKPTLL